MNQANRVWLITGVSSGIGKALSEQVLERGDTVVGTVRKTEQVDTFSALAPGRAFACHLDLSDSERVKPAVTEAIDKIGWIDVVVNCAGYGLAGAVEEVNDAELRHQMETNFFGLLQVTQAALPFMRKQRSGHIINVTSTSGQIGYPGLALYCASKHAVEGLSDALAAEVSPLGINVTIIEPDGFRTNWSSSSAIVRSQTVISDYEPTAGVVKVGLEQIDGKQIGDPIKAAKAIISIVESPNPPLRLVLGAKAVTGIRNKLNAMIDEINAWEHVSKDTAIDE